MNALDAETVEMLLKTSSREARLRYHEEEFLRTPAYDHGDPREPRSYVATCQSPRCNRPILVGRTGSRRYCSQSCCVTAWYWRHREVALARQHARLARKKQEAA